MNSLKINPKSESGFTLMELIVVIGIIAILIAILLPQFNGYTDKANAISAKSNAKTALTAVNTYKTEIDIANHIWSETDAETAMAKALGESNNADLKRVKKIEVNAGTANDNITIKTIKGNLTFLTTLEFSKGQMGTTKCSGDSTRCKQLQDAGSVDK